LLLDDCGLAIGDVKISDIEVFPLGYVREYPAPFTRSFALVKVTTDEGVSGRGEASDCFGHSNPQIIDTPPSYATPHLESVRRNALAATDHIVIQNLSKVFSSEKGQRQVKALDNVNLRVEDGQFFAVLGPSGCGKSTLLRLVGGLIEPSGGQIIMGNGEGPRDAQRAKEIGFVFQDAGLLPWKTVTENIELPLEVNRKSNRPRQHTTNELLDLVGLTQFTDAYPYQLSGGMQQRVAIARALSFDPRILLMDEPFGALDEITRQAMRYELLRIWERSRKTVVFVTHSIPEAIILSDAVAVMSPRPGRVRGVVEIKLPRPRNEEIERTPEFLGYTDRLKRLLREDGNGSTN
jgi:NitT/TauT family transport system ATP-binding protein